MPEIKNVCAREILDSRGNPTVEAEVILSDGAVGVGQVPSGASTGSSEALEKRDNLEKRYHGRGVLGALESVNEEICGALVGMDGYDLAEADFVMCALDGTAGKRRLGANSLLAVSIALAKAGANSLGIPLYRHLGGILPKRLPVPMMNVLNGGAHADNNLDIQEFMLIPLGAPSFAEGVRMCAEVYHTLSAILTSRGLSRSVGDEGGFAPSLESDKMALELLLEAIERAGYKAGFDIMLGLDIASSELREGKEYILPKRGVKYTSDELIDYISSLVENYPIFSVEDAVGEDDKYGWQRLTEKLSGRVLLVGDDLFVTDPMRVRDGIDERLGNAVLLKPNQIGTVSECAEASLTARLGGFRTVTSHRSGDTEDTFIADLSVALSSDLIKSGAPVRAERTAKYNRLMKIEEEMFGAQYGV